jgi:tetratricopeptide (TPR) repeat protein
MGRSGNFDAATLAQGSGQMVICSSSPEEQSWESARYKNGVFTRQLLEGLKAEGKKTKLGQAFAHLKTKVAEEVKEDRPGARQTPILSSKWNGEDLVLSAEVNPRPIPDEVLKRLEPDSFSSVKIASVTTGDTTAMPAAISPKGKLHVNLKYFALPEEPAVWVKRYTQAIKVDPKNPDGFYQRALGLMHLKKYVESHNDLQQAIRNTPNGAKYHLALGLVHHLRGNDVSAVDEVKTAIFYDFSLPKEFDFSD